MRASHALSMLLIVVVAVLAGLLSQRFSASWDWTHGNRNTLTAASQRVVDALDEEAISFTAYIYPGPRRDRVRTRLARYTRASDNVELTFADPARHPEQVRALGIGDDGAVQISYRGRHETITAFDEANVTAALQRLSASGDQWIVFLGGHGERAPDDETNGGYSELAAALDGQGMTTRTLRLADAAAIPDNTAVLVIASPQQSLLPGEVDMIRDYVAGGGAVLWADDPGERYGLSPLATELGVRWAEGTLIYPDYRKLGTGHPAIALVANYPDTPITERLNRLSVFPFAGALAAREDSGWRQAAFLRSSTRSWLETGPIEGDSLTFEPDAGDRRGPQTLGLALMRERAGRDTPQRAAVVADSDFMANGHIDTLGNRTLALSLFQWLAGRDAQIAVDVARAPDASLQMTPAHIRWLWWLFVVVVPLALVALGTIRWWLRRRR